MSSNRFDLGGRLAVVTGARRGIGRAMARALAEAGADVIGVSANLEASGSDVEKDVTAAGRSFEAIRTDFADPAAVAALGADLAGRERPVDILVNNAGTIRRAPAAQHSDADWDLVLQVNLSAQFVLARAVGERMVQRGRGKIVFTASLLSFQGGITVPGYTAAKHGIAGLTKTVALEAAAHGITANAICPGYVWTPLVEKQIPATMQARGLTREQVINDVLLAGQATKKFVSVEEIGALAVYLSGEMARSITGALITIDGGWTAA